MSVTLMFSEILRRIKWGSKENSYLLLKKKYLDIMFN